LEFLAQHFGNTRVVSPPSYCAHLLFKNREITGQPMNGSRQVLSAVPAFHIPEHFRPQAAHHRTHRHTCAALCSINLCLVFLILFALIYCLPWPPGLLVLFRTTLYVSLCHSSQPKSAYALLDTWLPYGGSLCILDSISSIIHFLYRGSAEMNTYWLGYHCKSPGTRSKQTQQFNAPISETEIKFGSMGAEFFFAIICNS
jgi:hypothetical protein